MRNQGMKILTGATVTLLLSAVAVGPAMAGPSAEVAQRQQMGQMNAPNTIRGTIKSIVGEVVKVQEPNGNVIELRLSKRDQGILGLVSGMDIVAQLVNGRVVDIAMATAAASQTASVTRTTITAPATMTRPVAPPAPSPATITRPVLPPPVQPAPVVRPVAPPPVVQPVVPMTEMPARVPVPPARPVRALW